MTDHPTGAGPLVFVGGCHRDVVARTLDAFEPGTSCPGVIAERPGGVARNVAVLVAGAGLPVGFVGRVGADPAGRALAEALSAAGVEPVELRVDADARTGTYVAVHGADGELVAGVSDLSIYDRVTPAELDASPALAAAAAVFADANLPVAALARLATRFGPRLAVDAISRAKAPRLRGVLGTGALVFVNLPSAEALVGRPLADPAAAAAALAGLRARRAVVTGGARPVAVLDGGVVTLRPVPACPVVDVTGAGDALSAGTLAALARGRPLADAVDVGIAAARAALAGAGALARLADDVVAALAPSPEGARP